MIKKLSILALLIGACGTTTSPKLPAGYVATPHGLVHSSCVKHLPPGHTVGADGVVKRPAGMTETLPQCGHPRLHPRTLALITMPMSVSAPAASGWIEKAYWVSDKPLGYLSAQFVVPPAPTLKGSLIYFFPGSEPADKLTILQPVLQYGTGAAGGGNYWSAVSWYCCPSGWTLHSDVIPVNTGDVIVGTMTATCSGSACNWKIVTADQTTNTSTALAADNVTDSFVWNVGAVMEAYYVRNCNQYPAGGPLAFTNLTLRDENGVTMLPNWTNYVASVTPDCGYNVSSTPATVTLTY